MVRSFFHLKVLYTALEPSSPKTLNKTESNSGGSEYHERMSKHMNIFIKYTSPLNMHQISLLKNLRYLCNQKNRNSWKHPHYTKAKARDKNDNKIYASIAFIHFVSLIPCKELPSSHPALTILLCGIFTSPND